MLASSNDKSSMTDPSSFAHLSWHYFSGATGGGNFFLRTVRKGVRLDVERFGQFAIAQHFDVRGIVHQTFFKQRLRRYLGAGIKLGIQRIKVDHLVFDAKDIGETTRVWQTPHEWQLTTFKVGFDASSSPCALTLGTAPSGLALPCGNPTPYATLAMLGPFGGFQIV